MLFLFTGDRFRIVQANLSMKIFIFCFVLAILYQCVRIGTSSGTRKDGQRTFDLPTQEVERNSFNGNSLAPYNAPMGVASSNVIAYSNGNDSFYSNESNYLYGIFTGLKWQCVEYARRWTLLRKGSTFERVNGASDMWSQLKHIERVTDKAKFALRRYPNGSPHPPTNESYLIYPIQKDMPYGHVAVIVDVLPGVVRIAEQNYEFTFWKYNYSREIPVLWNNGFYYVQDEYQIDGWMQIDEDQQLDPLNERTIGLIERTSLDSFASRVGIEFSCFLLSFFLAVRQRSELSRFYVD